MLIICNNEDHIMAVWLNTGICYIYLFSVSLQTPLADAKEF